MRHSVVAAAIVAGGLVAAVLALRPTSVVEAGVPHNVSFELSFADDQTRSIGTVPAGHTLVLHDFYTRVGAGFFEVLADGAHVGPSILELGGSAGFSPSLNFVAGVSIPGGARLSIHRLPGTSSPVVTLYVGALLQ
jgi:hypothetical protein